MTPADSDGFDDRHEGDQSVEQKRSDLVKE